MIPNKEAEFAGWYNHPSSWGGTRKKFTGALVRGADLEAIPVL